MVAHFCGYDPPLIYGVFFALVVAAVAALVFPAAGSVRPRHAGRLLQGFPHREGKVGIVDARAGETFTFYAFPDSHWIKLRTNNPRGARLLLTKNRSEIKRKRARA